MKKYFLALTVVAALLFAACEKDNDSLIDCSLPSTAVPASMVGKWASGYNSSTQIVDAYNGRYLGNAWQSGKYFQFTADGKYAEFYYMASSGTNASTATKVIGTVSFNENEGTFVFHACKGHYKGWQNGKLTVDRPATDEECANYLTSKYYYSFETSGGNTWMQIRFTPTGSASSFRAVN